MRFSHFLGNVIGYVLYFSLLGVLRIFAPRGYFRKTHMGRREGLSLSTAYWLNYTLYTCDKRGARWLSGRVSDSGARGPGFETYRRRVVSLSKTLYSPKVLVTYPGSDGSVPI